MELTAEQRAVIEADAAGLAVTAGAGSGKTHVLVERYLRMLREAAIPEIAAVTFTEAAATEMRERVRRAVMSDASLARHRADLDEAAIGTIHSLALRLLREHPIEAAIDPSAEVLGEDEAELLRRAASSEAIDAAAEAGDARTVALREVGVFFVGQHLPRMIAQRDDAQAAFAAMGGGPDDWRMHIRRALDAYEAQREAIRTEAATLAADIERELPRATDRLAEVARGVLDALADLPGAPTWDAATDALARASARTDLRPGGASASAVAIRDAFRRLRELADEAPRIPAWNEHDERALDAVEGLHGLFADAVGRYEAAKRERRALDFLDLETGAVALLSGHPAVAAEVRGGLRHLMVDEAQDINPAQAELIRLLSASGGDEPAPRLFLVGDAKQSIYRFRGADVARFAALRELAAASGQPVLPLSRSFRTHDRLVEAVNGIFTEVFADASEPFEAVMEPMTGRPAPPPGGGPHLTLLPIGKPPEGGRGEEHARRRAEANAGAAEIAALLDSGREVWDRETGGTRPARPGDVAVLLRRFSNVHTFEQALEAHGVPYATPGGAGFFTRQEVLDCVHLLRWLAEPDDAIALAGLLRSPFFILRDDTLLALREHGPLFPALRDPPPSVEGKERERCAHAARVLGELRAAAGALPADALLEHALERSGVEASWAPIEGGEQARANIRKLARIVRELAGHTLAEVVEYLEQRRDDLDVREGPAVLDRPDAVQVMTVHAAKGLEFPIVWIPEAHSAPHVGWEPVRWRRDEGVSVTLQRTEDDDARRRPGFYAHLRQRDAREDEAEHRRLFYVAATRAADHLLISGDDSGERGWLHAALDACAGGTVEGVDVREPVPADLDAVARRAAPRHLDAPAGERDYTAPLLARPRVIPVRASTPVTALREPSDAPRRAARGDGRGALLGSVVHRAIEESGGAVASLDPSRLAALTRDESERALDDAAIDAVAADAASMLGRFAATPVAAALADPAVERWFELPFAWDWDGLPVHGAIDLAYRDASGWHVIDFKTDRLDGTTADAIARRYLVQIGLYQRALAAAVGGEPTAGLLFLRTGELVEPDGPSLDAALAEARARVDAGALLDPEALDADVLAEEVA